MMSHFDCYAVKHTRLAGLPPEQDPEQQSTSSTHPRPTSVQPPVGVGGGAVGVGGGPDVLGQSEIMWQVLPPFAQGFPRSPDAHVLSSSAPLRHMSSRPGSFLWQMYFATRLVGEFVGFCVGLPVGPAVGLVEGCSIG